MQRDGPRRTDGVQLDRAIAQLGKGDVLMVTRLDRLARSTRDLLNMLDTGGGGRRVHFPRGRMVRLHHGAWSPDADGSWWAG